MIEKKELVPCGHGHGWGDCGGYWADRRGADPVWVCPMYGLFEKGRTSPYEKYSRAKHADFDAANAKKRAEDADKRRGEQQRMLSEFARWNERMGIPFVHPLRW